MLVSMRDLLSRAKSGGYAVGAFNVYNLEGVKAVLGAAEYSRSPAILQVHSKALAIGGNGLLQLCLTSADESIMPISVHLDHSHRLEEIRAAMDQGVPSVMADGSRDSYEDNLAFVQHVVQIARPKSVTVEAELGLISGVEDGEVVDEELSGITDPDEAADFVERTGIDCLAVCVGNVHGPYRKPPKLDFVRLEEIGRSVTVPLVLHGASGLPVDTIREAIALGVAKLNVNTDLRRAYVSAVGSLFIDDQTLDKTGPVSSSLPDLLDLMKSAVRGVETAVIEKMEVFGSAGEAMHD